jgi:hypothetical protein
MDFIYLTPKGTKPNLVALQHIIRVQPHRKGEGCLVFLTNKHEPLEVDDNIEVIEDSMRGA